MVGGMLTGYRVLGFDLETTGLNPYHDEVIEAFGSKIVNEYGNSRNY